MYVVFLRFSTNKAQAPAQMEGHNAWLRRGFEAGAFVLAGSLQPGLGGAILVRDMPRADVETWVAADPFVAQGVVSPEIIEITPGLTDDRLAFLTN